MPRRTVLQLWIHPFQAHRHTLTLLCQGASPVPGLACAYHIECVAQDWNTFGMS